MKVLVPLAELELPARPQQRLAVTATVFLGPEAGPQTLLARAPVASVEIDARPCAAGPAIVRRLRRADAGL